MAKSSHIMPKNPQTSRTKLQEPNKLKIKKSKIKNAPNEGNGFFAF